jgi:hypothetical protein
MCIKRSLVILLAGASLAVASLFALAIPSPAFAQCGGTSMAKSSCITCHEKEAPVSAQGAWHIVHAHMDYCANCHGGNINASDKTLAHESLIANPLKDIYTDCFSCHPEDYAVLAGYYAAVLDVKPESSATGTPVPVESPSYHPIVLMPVSTTMGVTPPNWTKYFGETICIFLFLLSSGWLYLHHRNMAKK